MSLISRICLQLSKTTIELWHTGPTLHTIPGQKWTYAVQTIFLWHFSRSMTFNVHVLWKKYLCQRPAQDQRKSSDLRSKCWRLPWNPGIKYIKDQSRECHVRMSCKETAFLVSVLRIWPENHALHLIFNSAEAQVRLTDKPIISYLVEKSTAL